MSKPFFFVRRGTLGDDVTDAQAARYARQVARAIQHEIVWADRTGCDCHDPDAHEHWAAAADIYTWQTWRR